MTRRRALTAVLAGTALVAPAGPPAAGAGAPWSRDGHTGRVMLDGAWGLRMDRADRGTRARWADPATRLRWRAVSMPHVWNAGLTRRGFRGAVAWYRHRFVVPAGVSERWRLRFESTHHTARAWVDGRPVGTHRGGFLPWETDVMELAPGPHELRLRTDNRPRAAIVRTGGYAWWNWGGVSREVYLRPVRETDLRTVAVHPKLHRDGTATLDVRAEVENPGDTPADVNVRAEVAGQTVTTAVPITVPPRSTARAGLALRIARPIRWSPRRPHLYPVRLSHGPGGDVRPSYAAHVGIRAVTVERGQLHLNGRRLFLRGISLHEHMSGVGAALRPRHIGRQVAALRELRVNATRAQYPLHPAMVEEFDRRGILLWVDAPIGWLTNRELADPEHRRIMTDYLRTTVSAQMQHPSIWVWGLGNELAIHQRPRQGVRRYLREAAALVRALDPTRLVGTTFEAHRIALPGRPYAPVDVLGANSYFGWYGPDMTPGTADFRASIRRYTRGWSRHYRGKALVITEAGGEGAAPGPLTQRGSFAFQRRLLRSYLRTAVSCPLLDGVLVWTLRDFAVRPGWHGGNRFQPRPPLSQKGVLTLAGRRKPAFGAVRSEFRRVARLRPSPYARAAGGSARSCPP
jgi:beta-glucuronidase